MSIIKVPWYVLRVKNMNSWLPLDPYGTLGMEKLSFSVLEKENKNGNTYLFAENTVALLNLVSFFRRIIHKTNFAQNHWFRIFR